MELSRNAAKSQRSLDAPCFYAASPAGPWAPWARLGGARWAVWGEGAYWGEWALWAHGALWGISEAISSGWPFRVDGYFDWMAISSGWLIYLSFNPLKTRFHNAYQAGNV